MHNIILTIKLSGIIGLAAMFSGLVVLLVGISFLYTRRFNRMFVFYMALTVIPLFLGIAGMRAGFLAVEKTRQRMEKAGVEEFEIQSMVQANRDDVMASVHVGIASFVLPFLLGVIGFIVRKESEQTTFPPGS